MNQTDIKAAREWVEQEIIDHAADLKAGGTDNGHLFKLNTILAALDLLTLKPIDEAPHGEWALVNSPYGDGCWQACWHAEGYWLSVNNMRISPTHYLCRISDLPIGDE